jgi:predicted trehalose synthase
VLFTCRDGARLNPLVIPNVGFPARLLEATDAHTGPTARALLDLFLIEKAAYEIAYEVTNRPTWIGVPIAGLARLATRILDKETRGRNN